MEIKGNMMEQQEIDDRNIDLSPLAKLDGVMGTCLVDCRSGQILGSLDNRSAIDLSKIATHYVELMLVERRMLKNLDLKGQLEDMLIALNDQYHVVRPLAGVNDGLFVFMILHRATANLGMTRHSLRDFEKTLGDLSI